MSSHDYHIEMSFTPFATLLTPQEVVTFTEGFALPTLEALERLGAAGRIVAGGTTLAAVAFSFIARASSPQELEEMVTTLPLWNRAQTRVVPLGTFESRAGAIRDRLEKAREAVARPAPSQRSR